MNGPAEPFETVMYTSTLRPADILLSASNCSFDFGDFTVRFPKSIILFDCYVSAPKISLSMDSMSCIWVVMELILRTE